MKFTCKVDIDAPIQKVVELFNNPDNLRKWQDGFISFEHISGNKGEAGSKSRLLYKAGKNGMELIETILVNNLPQEMKGLYEHKHMVNTMSNLFTELENNKTRYVAEIEYTKFIGFIPRMMSLLMPGLFKKQTQKFLNRFKRFVENEK